MTMMDLWKVRAQKAEAEAESSAALVRKLAEALALLFEVLETYGSISACPFESSTDYGNQVTTYRCYGCAATGIASWPDWKVEFTHAPNCKWTEAESLLSDPAVENILKTGACAKSGESS